jgi:phage-related protein
MATRRPSPYELRFYDESDASEPVREWIKKDLSADERRSLGAAMREVLQERGINVCGTRFGEQLGEGLFEFRLREEGLLLRVFCHAYGNKLILLLGAYDKGRNPSEKRQRAEIRVARNRLEEWQSRQKG